MSKRQPSLDPRQLGFTFDAPIPARREADLAGLDKVFASSVSEALKGDARSRAEIAGAMTALLAEDVTPLMLDAYASEARTGHNVPAHRFFALIAATDRYDVLDNLVRRIGAALLIGEEIQTAQLGHIDREIAHLKAKRRNLEKSAKPIVRGNAQ